MTLTTSRADSNGISTLLPVRWQVAVWLGWVATRILLLVQANTEEYVFNDVRYYYGGMEEGLHQGLREYPLVGLLPAHLARVAPTNDSSGYIGFFILLTLLMDAAFLAFVLYQRSFASSRAGRVIAAVLWIVTTALHGTLFLSRLDLFPSLLVGLSTALLATAPIWAAVILAAATMTKLWPGILAIGLVGSFRARTTYLKVGAFAGTLVLLAALVMLLGGPDRLLSPFEYQEVRGIQVESVAASLLMLVAATVGPANYTVEFAESKSFEITGPGDTTVLAVADAAFLALFVLAFGWAVYRFLARSSVANTRSTVVLWLCLILALILVNKVFSPQYILWVIPTLLVALARTNWHAKERYLAGAVAIMTILLVWLTEQIYPTNYGDVIYFPEVGFTLGVQFLLLRNLLLVITLITACAWWCVVANRERPQSAVTSESSK